MPKGVLWDRTIKPHPAKRENIVVSVKALSEGLEIVKTRNRQAL